MVKSRDAKLKKLEEDGKITERLRKSFMSCTSSDEVDELWAPFKEKHSTNSAKAQSIPGLTELAEFLEGGSRMSPRALWDGLAAIKIPSELQSSIPTIQVGVQHIVTDMLAHDPANRKLARECYSRQFSLQAHIVLPKTVPDGCQLSLKEHKEKLVKGSNYRDYHEYNRLLHSIPHHQLLAIRRGCGLGSSSSGDAKKAAGSSSSGHGSGGTVLSAKMGITDYGQEKLERRLRSKYQLPQSDPETSSTLDSVVAQLLKRKAQGGSPPEPLIPWGVRNRLLGASLSDAIKKSITPSLAKEAHKESLKAADAGAVEVFAGNLHRLLLTPPLASYFDTTAAGGANNLCVVDPGFAHGHKCIVFSVAGGADGGASGSGCIKETRKLIVRQGNREREESAQASAELAKMCRRHGVRLVVVGDGIGSQQAVNIVRQACGMASSGTDSGDSAGRKRKSEEMAGSIAAFPEMYTVVSECGASVYSASEVAQQEYPGVDISFLGCMSIGSRLVDPLSELVKIPPESLGIGLYQHDIAPKTLLRRLKEVVEVCVNEVGVDLNSAGVHILKYVSGIDETKARSIVAHRETLARTTGAGGFQSLEQLKDVKGIGAITFKNAAGFLRLREGTEPLDSTCIHPEQYKVARKLLTLLGEHRPATAAGKGKGDKKAAGFTSSDIGCSIALHRAIADTVAALANPTEPGRGEMAARASGWGQQLGLSPAALDDMLDWLSLRSAGSSTAITPVIGGSTASTVLPAKKASLIFEGGTEARSAGGARTDDIRLLRGVPPELIKPAGGATGRSGAGNKGLSGGVEAASAGVRVLEVGMKLTGKVKNLAPFGAFVDLGSGVTGPGGSSRQRDGLLHISAFNQQPKGATGSNAGLSFATVTVGQQIEVMVVSIDNERGRVGLGLQ